MRLLSTLGVVAAVLFGVDAWMFWMAGDIDPRYLALSGALCVICVGTFAFAVALWFKKPNDQPVMALVATKPRHWVHLRRRLRLALVKHANATAQ